MEDKKAICYFPGLPQVVRHDSGLYYVYVEAVRRFEHEEVTKLSLTPLIVEVQRFKEIFGGKRQYHQTIDAVEEKLLQLRSSQNLWLPELLWSISTRLTGIAQLSSFYPNKRELGFSTDSFVSSYTTVQVKWSPRAKKEEISLRPDDFVLWIGDIRYIRARKRAQAQGLLVYRNRRCTYEQGTIDFEQLCSGRTEAIESLLGDVVFRKVQNYQPEGKKKEDYDPLLVAEIYLPRILLASGMRFDDVTSL